MKHPKKKHSKNWHNRKQISSIHRWKWKRILLLQQVSLLEAGRFDTGVQDRTKNTGTKITKKCCLWVCYFIFYKGWFSFPSWHYVSFLVALNLQIAMDCHASGKIKWKVNDGQKKKTHCTSWKKRNLMAHFTDNSVLVGTVWFRNASRSGPPIPPPLLHEKHEF